MPINRFENLYSSTSTRLSLIPFDPRYRTMLDQGVHGEAKRCVTRSLVWLANDEVAGRNGHLQVRSARSANRENLANYYQHLRLRRGRVNRGDECHERCGGTLCSNPKHR